MQIRRLIVSAFCLVTGLALGTTLTLHSQSRVLSLADLQLQKRDVSRMDWVLLNARVTALQMTPMQESSRFVSPLDFAYDDTSKKIVARAFVNPEWFSQANAQQVKTVFTMRAIDFCGVAVAGALKREGSPVGLSWQGNCSVDFFTWITDISSSVSSRDVAFYENGQLALK